LGGKRASLELATGTGDDSFRLNLGVTPQKNWRCDAARVNLTSRGGAGRPQRAGMFCPSNNRPPKLPAEGWVVWAAEVT